MTANSLTEWNTTKESELIDRLTQSKNPKFKISVSSIQAKEYEECTHHPQIGAMPMYPNVKKPKLYYESVSRRQKVIAEKELKSFVEENEHLEVERKLKRWKEIEVHPPSFLEREEHKRKILFYVDITVKPGRYDDNEI